MRSKKSRAVGFANRIVSMAALSLAFAPVFATAAMVLGTTMSPSVVYAQEEEAPANGGCPEGQTPAETGEQPEGRAVPCLPSDRSSNFNGTCDEDEDAGNDTDDPAQCLINKYVQPTINVLAAMVGITVTISIIVAGIQYATSADNSQKVSAAKQRMVTSIFVLVGFGFFYAFLNYVIPGGLLPVAGP